MARPLDEERRTELLDAAVAFLAERGLAELSLRPMAKALGVSLSGLVHHFGSKDRLVVEALERAIELQTDVRAQWLRRHPAMSQADQLRTWWKWINASKANLALVRLGIEAAALDATTSGLPGDVRADQIGLWRSDIEARLVVEGLTRRAAVIEASVTKALFTGLVVDLLASGDRRRLTRALEVGLTRLEHVIEAAARRPPAARASSPARTR